ncbi:nectin-4-like [Petromyzon marinus]|uniref:Nectin-4-like n=1 Tax=Petromyzon marinus TaxID=7757 RepID=A0AAJ7UEA2_PETMA|nr:nectin-4-like [Petromyzon marinus]
MSVRFIVALAAIVVLTKAEKKTTITVTHGDSAKMVCSYVASENVTFTQMEWKKKAKDSTVAILNPDNMIHIPDNYIGRVTIGVLHNMASEMLISNVTAEDEGDYKCSVTTFPPIAREMHFTLKVNAPQPPPTQPPQPPNVSAIVLGVLFLVAAIAAGIFAYLWKEKEKNVRKTEDHNQPLRGQATA